VATDATGTVTSPDSIARILPTDLPAVTALTSGVNAISTSVQTALTTSYPRWAQSAAGTNAPHLVVVNNALGNEIEFGHNNTAGYRSILGNEVGSGTPNLVFHGEQGTTSNTYRTRGLKASILKSDASGGFVFANAPTASADNQAAVNLVTIDSNGVMTFVGTSSGVRSAWNGVYSTVQHTFAAADAAFTFNTSYSNTGNGTAGTIGDVITWAAASNTRLTFVKTGSYKVTWASLNNTLTAPGGTMGVQIRLNGTTAMTYMGATAPVAGSLLSSSGNFHTAGAIDKQAPMGGLNFIFSAGDYIELMWMRGTSTAATDATVGLPMFPTVGTGFTWLMAEYLGR
jgi:hypothetical protein